MICNICQKPIKKNEKIKVTSGPLIALDDQCNYDYVIDFFKNQQIFHWECQPKEVERVIQDEPVVSVDLEEFVSYLKTTGIKSPNRTKAMEIASRNNSLESAIKDWFKSESTVMV